MPLYLCLLVSSAGSLFQQFVPTSAAHENVGPDGIQTVGHSDVKNFSKNLILKIQQSPDKNHEIYQVGKKLTSWGMKTHNT